MLTVPTPRLLPVTIGLLAGLLAMKSVGLVRAASPSAHGSSSHGSPSLSVTQAAPQPKAHATPAAKDAHATAATAAGHGAAPAAPTEEPPAAPAAPQISEAERAILLELRQRRQELDAREQSFAARESVLAAAEQKLTARADELQALQKRLETLEAARAQRDDASWHGLVKLYETMKPRDAAAIFNELGMPVLLPVIDRMKEGKAAAVLSAMNPDKARDVTTELAKWRTRRESLPPAEPLATPAPTPRPS